MMEMISELRQNELVCREVQVMEKNGKQYIYYQNTVIYMRISDPNVLNKKDVYDIQCYQNKKEGGEGRVVVGLKNGSLAKKNLF